MPLPPWPRCLGPGQTLRVLAALLDRQDPRRAIFHQGRSLLRAVVSLPRTLCFTVSGIAGSKRTEL
eukprot:6204597-Lingulodinium_polyedra.AAC.1